MRHNPLQPTCFFEQYIFKIIINLFSLSAYGELMYGAIELISVGKWKQKIAFITTQINQYMISSHLRRSLFNYCMAMLSNLIEWRCALQFPLEGHEMRIQPIFRYKKPGIHKDCQSAFELELNTSHNKSRKR